MFWFVVCWVLVGGIFGWLASRKEQGPSAVLSDVKYGILTAVLAGLVWFPFFRVDSEDPFIRAFNFLLFSVFSAICGAAPGLWLVHSLQSRGRGSQRQRQSG